MIFNMVGGGANSKAFAMVLVNYPQNSTLTATNVDGYQDIAPASAASPQRLYYVSAPADLSSTQTCVFTCTDGTRTATKTVSGITIATAQTIDIVYEFVLYDSGTEYIPLTVVGQQNVVITRETGFIHLAWQATNYTNSAIRNSTQIDISNFDTLNAIYTCSQRYTETEFFKPGIGISDTSFNESTQSSTLQTRNLLEIASSYTRVTQDISSIVGNKYVGVLGCWEGNLKKLWLE